jgi:hypothetical protein
MCAGTLPATGVPIKRGAPEIIPEKVKICAVDIAWNGGIFRKMNEPNAVIPVKYGNKTGQ